MMIAAVKFGTRPFCHENHSRLWDMLNNKDKMVIIIIMTMIIIMLADTII